MTLRRALAVAVLIVGTTGGAVHASVLRPVGSVVSTTWVEQATGQVVLAGGRAYAIGGNVPVGGQQATSTVSRLLPDGRPTSSVRLVGSLEGGAYGHGGLWFIRGSGARPEFFPGSLDLVKLAPRGLAVLGQVYVGRGGGPFVTEHAVWATPQLNHRLLRVDPTTLTVTGVRRFHGYLEDVAAAGNRVWVIEDRGSTPGSWLIGVDDQTLKETLVVPFPSAVGGLAATGDRLFLQTSGPSVVIALDADSGRQLWHRSLSSGDGVTLAAAADDSVWYLTTDGRLGHVAASGRSAGAPIDLSRLHPYGINTVRTGVQVLVAGGFVTVR